MESRRKCPKMEELDKSLGDFELSVWFAYLHCGKGPWRSVLRIIHAIEAKLRTATTVLLNLGCARAEND
jgi:hypothetical protein